MSAAFKVIDLITSNIDKKYEPAGHMASAIIEHFRKHGGCLPQDLNSYGFSPDEVARYGPLAHAIAQIELKLLKGEQ